MKDLFARVASKASLVLGHPATFLVASLAVVLWAATGPLADYSENWQLIINTSTTIITFLSVFLIQNSQNRESRAMQIKLDELIRAVKDARNGMIDLEEASDADLDRLAREFRRVSDRRQKHEDHPRDEDLKNKRD